MTTPTGQISAYDINIELGRPGGQQLDLNDSAVRALAGIPSGTISMNDLRGKSALAFNPVSGESLSSEGYVSAAVGVSATQDCVWSWTRQGGLAGQGGNSIAYSNLGQNGTGTTFSLAIDASYEWVDQDGDFQLDPDEFMYVTTNEFGTITAKQNGVTVGTWSYWLQANGDGNQQ